MEKKQLIGFIDLLGTKENSKIADNAYYSAIKSLHRTLKKCKNVLTEGYSIKGFSDCAFFALNVDEKSIIFLELLRESLFSEGYYFKCSIILDRFEVIPSGSNNESYSSVIFGPQSVDAYLIHEKYKGIGYVVDKKINEIDSFKTFLVPTLYIIYNGKALIFKKSLDIKFNSSYVGDKNFITEKNNEQLKKGLVNHSAELNINKFIKSFVVAKTKNNIYAKYYFSMFISLINSSDFSHISYSSKGEWEGAPVIFFKIFFDKSFEQSIKNINGSGILHFAAINKLYEDFKYIDNEKGEFDIVINELALIISKKAKILEFIGKVPSFIFKSNYKIDFLDRVADFQLNYK